MSTTTQTFEYTPGAAPDPAELAAADVIIVAVPTPVDAAHIPDFSPLADAGAAAAAASVASILRFSATSRTSSATSSALASAETALPAYYVAESARGTTCIASLFRIKRRELFSEFLGQKLHVSSPPFILFSGLNYEDFSGFSPVGSLELPGRKSII
mgnify:CR=1 FL=1